MGAQAFLDVQDVLHNAASHRRCGTATNDLDALKEALEEAYEQIADLSDTKAHDLAIEAKDEEIEALKDEACCALPADERKRGKPCKNDDCAACRLAWAALEKDCGTTDERRTAGLCGASHLGVDRCCECAAHLLKIETDGTIAEQDAEIERLTKERDEARAASPSESADTIAQLRGALATAQARHDCGRADRESGTPCPRRDLDGGTCDECWASGMRDSIVRAEESKREALTREIEGLRNALQTVTAERNAAIIAADSRPVTPAKVRPAKTHDGPSLFDLLPVAAPPAAKVKRAKRAGVKKYPLAVKK